MVLPRLARGAGTLIPSAQRFVWAAKQALGKAVSNFTFTLHFHALEKEMATHSSVLAWRIPWTKEPGGVLFIGLQRVGHD